MNRFEKLSAVFVMFNEDYRRWISGQREVMERELRWEHANKNSFFHNSIGNYSLLVSDNVHANHVSVPAKLHTMFDNLRGELNGFLSGIDWAACQLCRDVVELDPIVGGARAFNAEDVWLANLRRDIQCSS